MGRSIFFCGIYDIPGKFFFWGDYFLEHIFCTLVKTF